MASSNSAAFQVYLRIVEAKGLKGVEKNGTSDPFVKIRIDGQQTDLETKVVLKSTNPIWHQEFIVSVPKADSSIEFKIYDWNRIQSNVSLGMAKLNLEQYTIGVFHSVNLNLDTQGHITVMLLMEPYPVPLAKPVKERLSQMRIQLENSAYYPGSTLRGVAVYSTTKPVKLHGLTLTIAGWSWVHWTGGTQKHRVHYSSSHIYINLTVPFIGAVGKEAKKTVVDLAPGAYLFPFEYVLPMELPPSYAPSKYGGYHIMYQARFHADVKGKSNKSADVVFRVLPNHKLVRAEQIGVEMSAMKAGALGKDEPVKLLIHGPVTAFTGESYKLHCKIDNTMGKKDIESMSILLRRKEWIYARWTGYAMIRRWGKNPLNDWKFSTFVAAGTSWEGDVDVQIPEGLVTSLHSTMCPNIQNAYYFKLKVATSGNVFSNPSGESRYNILMADNNRGFEGLPCPATPEGPLNELWTAPAPPNIFSMLPPAVTKDGSIVPCGRVIDAVGKMPGAHQVPSITLIGMVPLFILSTTITPDEWTPGMVPTWVKHEGMSPDEKFEMGEAYQPPENS